VSSRLPGSSTVSGDGITTVFVSLEQLLRSGETLTGTATAVEVESTDLTITNVAKITTAVTVPEGSPLFGHQVSRRIIPANQGLLFSVSAPGDIEGSYAIEVSCATTGATPAQTLTLYVDLEIA